MMASDKVLLEILTTASPASWRRWATSSTAPSFTVFVKETWDFDSRADHARGGGVLLSAQHRRHQHAGDRSQARHRLHSTATSRAT